MIINIISLCYNKNIWDWFFFHRRMESKKNPSLYVPKDFPVPPALHGHGSQFLNTAFHRPKEHLIFLPAAWIPIPHIEFIRNLPGFPAEVFRQFFCLVMSIFPLPGLAARQGEPDRFLSLFQQAPHHNFSANGKFHFV